jgi:hypothetical protein
LKRSLPPIEVLDFLSDLRKDEHTPDAVFVEVRRQAFRNKTLEELKRIRDKMIKDAGKRK